MSTIDPRELMTKDYRLVPTEELEELKHSIMSSIQVAERSRNLWHREYTAIRIELATRKLDEQEAHELPPGFTAEMVSGL